MKKIIYKYYRKIRVLIRGIVSSFLFKLIYRKGFNSKDPLLILGAPRSGSTWLAEIVSSLPGNTQIFEPLFLQYVKEAVDAGVQKNMYLPSKEEWKQGNVFFKKILTGRLMNPWIASQIPFSKVFYTQRLVIKFVRANLLMGWICENFSMRPPALVIRHPCAMVSSSLQKNWTPSKQVLLSNRYFDQHPSIHKKCKELTKPEQFDAMAWCLHYHAPLTLPKPYPFVLICYEKIVRDGVNEIGRLFDVWGLEMGDKIIDQLRKPSDTSTLSSQIITGADPLSGWKKRLTEQQITNILSVLGIFGMDFYSTDLEPDYEKLSKFSNGKQ